MKNKKFVNAEMIRDYILEFFPELLWWDNTSNKHEQYLSGRNYKHRQGMPNEIRIEFDGEDTNENWENINLTSIKLQELNYTFAIFSVEGGRSPHIHIYDCDELETLSEEQRREYRLKFLGKVCPSNSSPDLGLCNEKHLCALEFVNHFKHKKSKELLYYFWNDRNMGIDFDIKMSILSSKKKNEFIKTKQQTELKFGDRIRLSQRMRVMDMLSFEQVFEEYKINYRGNMALCPFHNDTDRSLSFSNPKKVWKCFGCDAKGDLITLIKKMEEKNESD